MMNIEKNYKEVLENEGNFAINIETGEMLSCSKCNCEECEFYGANNDYDWNFCEEGKFYWLFKECECKKSLLTEDEKEFLKSFINFFGCRVESIVKRSNNFKSYLKIKCDDDIDVFTPWLGPNNRFDKLEEGKLYSLKSLGLYE